MSLTLGYCSGNGSSIEPFNALFDNKVDMTLGENLDVDAVVFWGGTDIHWSLYKQPPHRSNQVRGFSAPTARDLFEWSLMKWCTFHKIPMIGVCRGAQMMCAFVGGDLIQDVSHHNYGTHPITTIDGETMEVASAHHQMMYPFDVPHELLAWSSTNLSTYYETGTGNVTQVMKDKKEPEVVWFPTIQGLAIQSHPEWMSVNSPANKWFLELVSDRIVSKIQTAEV